MNKIIILLNLLLQHPQAATCMVMGEDLTETRALSYHESGNNPYAHKKHSKYFGMYQSDTALIAPFGCNRTHYFSANRVIAIIEQTTLKIKIMRKLRIIDTTKHAALMMYGLGVGGFRKYKTTHPKWQSCATIKYFINYGNKEQEVAFLAKQMFSQGKRRDKSHAPIKN